MDDDPRRMELIADSIRRQGLLRSAALLLRQRLIPPRSRREDVYVRWLRPIGRLLPGPRRRAARVLGLIRWPPIPRPDIRTILVLKLDHIGDFLIAAPAFGLLRRSFPSARITLLCAPWNAERARHSGFFDAVATLAFFAPRADAGRPVLDTAALAGLGPFDLAIDLRADPDTRPVLMQIPATITAGYRAAGFEPGVSLPVPRINPAARDTRQHQRQLLLNLVALVIGRFDPASDAMTTARTEGPPVAVVGWARPVVAMSPASGRAIKDWPLDRFVAIGRAVCEELGGTLLLLGGPDQRPQADSLRAALGEAKLVDLVGSLTLAGSFGMLDAADAFIGNDTGLGHASAALGKPTLVLFSGVDPLPSWAPIGLQAVALKSDVTCAPCHLSDLALCPHGHLCMTAIPTNEVLAELRQLLDGGRSTAQAGKARPGLCPGPAGDGGPQTPFDE